jgi:NADH:ubiquinone oxidoreductase subunit E
MPLVDGELHERNELLKKETKLVVPELPLEELIKLDPVIDKYGGRAGYLIPALKEAQEIFGYVPWEVQKYVADGLSLSRSMVYGVVTFYHYFTITPRGRHTIRLCLGTACYVKGAKEMLDYIVRDVGVNVGETSEDGRFTLEAVRCLGACGLAPVMMINDDTHGNIDPKDTVKILGAYE